MGAVLAVQIAMIRHMIFQVRQIGILEHGGDQAGHRLRPVPGLRIQPCPIINILHLHSFPEKCQYKFILLHIIFLGNHDGRKLPQSIPAGKFPD